MKGKITKQDRILGEQAQELFEIKHYERLIDAVSAVLDAHHFQDRPTRSDRFNGIMRYFRVKNAARKAASKRKAEREETRKALQLQLFRI